MFELEAGGGSARGGTSFSLSDASDLRKVKLKEAPFDSVLAELALSVQSLKAVTPICWL